MKRLNNRETEYNIEDIFLNRYSPRAITSDISRDELMTLFDAARWAPSSNNIQPWRYVYAMSGTEDFNLFFSFLSEGNQIWCKNAGALVIGLSKKNNRDGKFNPKNVFDAGSSWENLALQATASGLVAHAMGGFDASLLRRELEISEEYEINVMIAVGGKGDIMDLPENLREREKPKERESMEKIVFEGKLGAKNLN